ncbi:MAG: hypothetical protein INH37_13050, partial [Myxococcaceae bacterium]|nr:hypothetical protein [Myxococcaceae bacterium]
MGPAGVAMAVALYTAGVAEPRLVDLVTPGEGRLSTRLENELRAGGFRPVRRRPDERPTAGVHGEVRWNGQGPIIVRRFSDDALEARFEDPGDDGVWAIRVVEWLRAEPLALAPPKSPVSTSVPEEPEARFDLGLGVVAKGAPGTGVGLGLSAQAGVWVSPRFGLQLAMGGPTWLTVARDE